MKDAGVERSLIVINPNSSTAVTAGIDRAVEPLRGLGLPIRCETLAEGPRGIESQTDADSVIAPMLAMARRMQAEAAGFVVACFSDPGLHAMRERASVPVLGIMESAVLTAMTMGHRFGVIAILPNSVPRHLRAFGAMGVTGRLAGDRALGLTVAELSDPCTTRTRMETVGRTLRDTDQADVLIMGCAGMADYRAGLETALGIPVIDPCQAAVSMAIGRIALAATSETAQ